MGSFLCNTRWKMRHNWTNTSWYINIYKSRAAVWKVLYKVEKIQRVRSAGQLVCWWGTASQSSVDQCTHHSTHTRIWYLSNRGYPCEWQLYSSCVCVCVCVCGFVRGCGRLPTPLVLWPKPRMTACSNGSLDGSTGPCTPPCLASTS